MAERLMGDLVSKNDDGGLSLTEAGEDRLKPWVTSTKENIYAFLPEADTQTVAAAMARLSRNSNGLLTIIADEFLGPGKDNKDTDLLRRVVSAFGDDSVMQLYPLQMVFEGVSQLATKEIEWGRLAAYLEQSTRYLRFDRKDENGNYAYVIPEEFDEATAELYKKYLDEIFDLYSESYSKLYEYITTTADTPKEERDGAWRRACHAQACDGVRAMLPAATKATVGTVGSSQAVNNMIFHLSSHELPEIQTLGQKALTAVRQVAPVFFERTDMPTRGELISNHMRTTREATSVVAERLLAGHKHTHETTPYVKLLSIDGSEDQLITKILTDASTFSYQEVEAIVAGLTDAEKDEALAAYVGDRYNRRAKPGRAFELPHYFFEVQCDFGAFRDIQRHRMVDGLEWQPLQTGLGHVKPEVIDQAGLTELYEHVFSLSEELYNELHERGFTRQAQYATLFGHIMRFNVKMNARSLMHTAELRTSTQGHPAYRRVYQEMHDQVAAVHPHIAGAMRFVSTDEDEALARLGAERAHNAKWGD